MMRRPSSGSRRARVGERQKQVGAALVTGRVQESTDVQTLMWAWLTSSGSGHGRMSTFSSAWRLLGPFRVAATIGFRLGHLACRRSADARTIAGLVGESDPAYRRDRLETSIATAISAIPARMVASAD
jgi:hypothetical protein